MAAPPAHTGYAFPGVGNLHRDIYPAISAADTPSLKQHGKVVLVTGASRGIGRAIALQYAHAGVACIILCARSASQLDTAVEGVNKINASVRVKKFPIDASIDADVTKCAKEVESQEGRLDILINNAGISTPWAPLARSDPSEWWRNFEVNLKGPYLLLHAFLPLMMSTAKGHGVVPVVINISSIEFVDTEYGAHGINAIAVHPGGVPKELGLSEPAIRQFLIDTPELCGGFCVWLTAGRTQLRGRYLSATWDVEKLEAMKEEITVGDKLKVKMAV